MKILSFGASTSSQSINRQLARYAANLVPGAEVTDLDLRQFELPLFSVDGEEQNGIPPSVEEFLALIDGHEALVISLAEHNGSYAAAFKNLYDWASRQRYEVWGHKPLLLMATSPGGRGGASVLAAAEATFPRMGAELKATFSLPNFHDNFSPKEGIQDETLKEKLSSAVAKLTA
ncbi:NADPH-dependent FMN reductase [Roseibacillus ishigakijimensis]|uniref:NAD(P)H-dependent oxidoreductase n=1 Tax=Roseibacillus ishigakijimensis TaxID=454146 RepID=A0A934VL24_9BACT|nr:NAD(P)H-dependent oxidoreductase [Roseibacillus ishigakijimensis]MBK1832430.1 NAD(P)H-dependent oxidoreductase [Roseibacillus ishigakijimensis]